MTWKDDVKSFGIKPVVVGPGAEIKAETFCFLVTRVVSSTVFLRASNGDYVMTELTVYGFGDGEEVRCKVRFHPDEKIKVRKYGREHRWEVALIGSELALAD